MVEASGLLEQKPVEYSGEGDSFLPGHLAARRPRATGLPFQRQGSQDRRHPTWGN
jgi:hypothetical protein